MTWLLLVFGVFLAVYGLVDDRDVVVLAGALLAASAAALRRIGGATHGGSGLGGPSRHGPGIDHPPGPGSPRSEVIEQLQRDMEAQAVETIRRARNL